MRDLLRSAIEQVAHAKTNSGGVSGVPTGFAKLDKLTGGWQKSDMVIVAARPGMGKTAFVRSMAPLDDRPFIFWDERLSTAAVTRELIAQDASRAKRAEVVDRMAAAYILQGVLDRMAALARAAAQRAE